MQFQRCLRDVCVAHMLAIDNKLGSEAVELEKGDEMASVRDTEVSIYYYWIFRETSGWGSREKLDLQIEGMESPAKKLEQDTRILWRSPKSLSVQS